MSLQGRAEMSGEWSRFSRFPLLAVGQGESQQPTDSSHFGHKVDLSNCGEVRKSGPADPGRPFPCAPFDDLLKFHRVALGFSALAGKGLVHMAAVVRAFVGYFFLVLIVRIVGRRPGKQRVLRR